MAKKKSKRKLWEDRIGDSILRFMTVYNGRKPEAIFMSEPLFKVLTGRKTMKIKTHFSGIRVEMYNSEDLEFFLVERIERLSENNL